ncbi:putative peptidase S10, serine carboxypeptidase, alpha/Beta hydrolase [Helianthus annuus]|uniref:Peptidase S10, serine carboxypeptidase, alpha/Beta hydrolase n=1 Tax=Helianthus annuus TaxID=4232 RepID=A0A251SGE5_HELAN|nr:serine carboxypeptidase-like 13 isoform X1 [Helianthus annuus]KAF5766720.1 putative peptidase S10, serine carboxypeptidase, alpha/Beta hydrolase [Helianthus annuus]KAJ0453069.1 putative peptidase S10, serine carboxypeptidase, alpha/Beta hydrolase [Helianthus annuus]KAJ0458174.1 putative peptidase S10, serine carboxypeptidase, alpha/Beta hydrolase [Helianthus annuus]KAJ0474980.1 putative peptidase S10, serine carboxypeptidase, alpha/Beta hydrolase [Helianthus annuus]KAJ0650535.1 putative pep
MIGKMINWFLIITFFICSHVSTSTSANSAGRVEYLPGFQGPLPFYLETGYVGVDENEDVQLFYYFIRSESDPELDPLMLWITGGPGCSSISGLLYEIGSIKFEALYYDGSFPTLILSPNSWTKMASIIFLDLPVGTGFSYARTTRASHSTDIQLCDQAYEFMRKWFESHPEFVSNPFYVGGDSYSGRPVPIITQLISDGNEAGIEPYINLKGYVLGNPVTFPEEDNYQIRFANGMGLISDELYKSLFHTCRGEYRSEYISTSNLVCRQTLELYHECVDGIETAHVLEPRCDSIFQIKLPTQKLLNEHNRVSSSYCRTDGYNLVYYWINEASVREALHIRKGTITDWIRCKSDLNFTKTLSDVRPYHLNLSNKGYRSLVYSGDHDMIIPYQSTEAWIKDLNYSVIDRWRSWKLNGQIAGYTESYSNMMTYATVKGGGHTAPEYKPEECFAMFKRWISNQPL